MNKSLYFCLSLAALMLAFPVSLHAQEEPDANHWGARYETLPGQPAHGLAFAPTNNFRPGRLDSTLPGQPGHSLAFQAMPGSSRTMNSPQLENVSGGPAMAGGPVRELPIVVPLKTPDPLTAD